MSLPPRLCEVHGEVESVSVTSFAQSADVSQVQIDTRDIGLSALFDLEREKVSGVVVEA